MEPQCTRQILIILTGISLDLCATTIAVCSLGMVFLSVSDSTDMGVEVESQRLLSGSSVVQSASGDINRSVLMQSSAGKNVNTMDRKLAEQLELEAREFQLAQDAHLAEQLQLKENSYRIPRCVV